MARKLVRIVSIGSVNPIPEADLIEVASVGGWKIVVNKGQFQPGDRAVYFEIDAFLPEGNPGWQFLVDKRAHDFNGLRGHVLRSVTLKKQTSQGYLMPLSALAGTHLESDLDDLQPGDDVAAALGVVKYDPPLPAELLALARGYPPGLIRSTDQERIQNLGDDLEQWRADGSTWEVTEKLEGWACAYALIDGEFHACSSGLDFNRDDRHPFWRAAAAIDIEAKLRSLGGRDFVVQGELIGPNLEGNNYLLQEPQFHLYGAYDVAKGRKLPPIERRDFAREFALPAVPLVDADFLFGKHTMRNLVDMADGPSVLNSKRRREGLVFKHNDSDASFKAISDKYLLNVKL